MKSSHISYQFSEKNIKIAFVQKLNRNTVLYCFQILSEQARRGLPLVTYPCAILYYLEHIWSLDMVGACSFTLPEHPSVNRTFGRVKWPVGPHI